ncbi:OmpA family protein [Niveibacterium umoris]|uniref:OOP family OmpA-OmpF porin n=1 Tax=Niveibacterium umoris TaxID=1193620 RepID=A0A840BH72_9RHOO|nr:OmpA family protein [Niveibacterium umoris]MBB4012003.1 OOP family OmpA-OmpF porin [Niveibacterium umoris]
MKQGSKKFVVAFAAALGMVTAAMAQQQEIKINPAVKVVPYAVDARSVVVRSANGLCWRTGYWTKELAASTLVEGNEFPVGCFCDKDLMPKEVCEPPKVEPKKEEPKPVVPATKPAAEKVTIAADALFDYDKAVLRDEGKATLTEFAAKAKALSIEVIIAVGHTDRLGSDKYNQALSERRAAAVKEFLVSQQIDPNRVYTEGKGKTQPVTQCKNLGAENGKNKKLVECLQPDRRVEIEVIGTKQQ